MLNHAKRFNIFCLLDNNGYSYEPEAFDCLLALGTKRSIRLQAGNAFETLKEFYNKQPSWLFGHFGYGLKNEVEWLAGSKTAGIDFGDGFFFEPEIIIRLHKNQVEITASSCIGEIMNEISSTPASGQSSLPQPVILQPGLSKENYIHSIQQLQQHIQRGDCYEINFCQQFFANEAVIDPFSTFKKLNEISPNPFAAFYRLNDLYCLCASPERYLKKKGNTVISQPIKGTAKRAPENPDKDAANKAALFHSSKERSENVMIVDLVRNDLARFCAKGSVQVKELFGIYSFPQVFQMISTIAGTVKAETHWTDCIKNSFPMGSMTGAPKKRVMQLIDEFETEGRGLFSGSVGYVNPNGDFDFNVVIRSIFYDAASRKISYAAGSGITYYSRAEDEYEECMLKAQAIREVFS